MHDSTSKRRWVLFFVAFMPLTAIWAIANPMLASPDEQIHIVRAQGLSNGDIDSPYTTDGVPIGSMECFRFQPEVSAACQDLTWGPAGTRYDIPTDDYPALFHAFAAMPTFLSSGLAGSYLMRLWLAAAASAITAWAAVLATRPGVGTWPITGLLVAITPMALFTMSTVNPSGLAVAFTALFVTGVLDIRTTDRTTKLALAAVTLGAVGLATMRRDGLLWLGVVVIALAPVLVSPRLIARFRRPTRPARRHVAATLGVLAALTYVIVSWVGPTVLSFLRTRSAGGGTSAWEAARYIRTYLYQAVGTFGWLDSPIGEEAFLIASLAAGTLLVVGLSGCSRRLASSTALAAVALVLAPVAVGVVTFPYLQGRYLLPILACCLIVAGRSAAQATTDQQFVFRITRIVLAAWAVVHVIGFVQNLRRYAVGRSGTWRFLVDSEWSPDYLSNLAAVVLFAAAIVNAVVVVTVIRRDLRPAGSDLFGESPGHPGEDRPSDEEADR